MNEPHPEASCRYVFPVISFLMMCSQYGVNNYSNIANTLIPLSLMILIGFVEESPELFPATINSLA